MFVIRTTAVRGEMGHWSRGEEYAREIPDAFYRRYIMMEALAYSRVTFFSRYRDVAGNLLMRAEIDEGDTWRVLAFNGSRIFIQSAEDWREARRHASMFRAAGEVVMVHKSIGIPKRR